MGGGGGEVSRLRHLVKDPRLADKADASAAGNPIVHGDQGAGSQHLLMAADG
jgi:hypothetical protein